MRRFILVATTLLLCACEGIEDPYRTINPTAPDGTGKVFMGREIARVLESEHVSEDVARPTRDVRELPDRLLRALNLTAADRVADIGAGDGYYTLRLADIVVHGRVFAVDLSPVLLDSVRTRSARAGLRNVEPVLGTVSSPGLEAESIDLALIVVSYHEFSHPAEMLEGLFAALRPGGRLALVEYRGEDDTIPVPAIHRMTEAQARLEVESVGFEFFDNLDVLPQQHVFIFRKPSA